MNILLNSMKNNSNYTYTENGALTHKSTMSGLMDMFAMGGAMRNRSDEDVILMFQKAYAENPELAMKMLFWLRDVRGGAGERRFFRVVIKFMANHKEYRESIRRNIIHVPEFGRWDDLYAFVDTPLMEDALKIIKHQLALDIECKTPSLLAKWLKSENTSSKESVRLGNITREYLNMSHRQYRKMLSVLRERINVLERLMSANRWDEIEFDKIPSKAGLIYKNAFARRDIIKAKYERFMKDENTKVNAKALYPYEVVEKAANLMGSYSLGYYHKTVTLNNIDRLAINKYWDNLTNYFNGATLDALCMVDTSSSMHGTPILVATSLGLYCAERNHGPWHNHYISFSANPRLVETTGVDFCDKVDKIIRADLCENTNIERAFDMVLNTALQNNLTNDDIPKNIIVISDMEFDSGARAYRNNYDTPQTLMENIAHRWASYGYEMPHLIYWNVDARHDNIPMVDKGHVTYVSGFSPSIFQSIMTGKSGWDLMIETITKERYAVIKA